MNKTEKNTNWEVQKGRLIKKFAYLTDNDLLFAQDKKKEIFEELQERLGKSKEEIQKIINGV
ncbi:MAG: CsbD family protein [Paludibacter sp.]